MEKHVKDHDIYRALRAHFDVMPVAYPASESGIEIDILKRFFSPEEAVIALEIGMLPAPARRIQRRLKRRMGKNAPGLDELKGRLDTLVEKKVINSNLVKGRGGERRVYGKLPFAVGLYEFQVDRLTRDFEEEAAAYMDEAFMHSFLDEKPRQMRTIPINETILPDRSVSRYDSIREVILSSEGPFVVQECICRKGRSLLGEECRQTQVEETCLSLGPAAMAAIKEGRGRELDREDTLLFLEKSEREGLVLQAQNTRNPIYICSCCSCCCAILSRAKKIPNPGDILGSNYRAEIDESTCLSCGNCIPRCPMDAIELSPPDDSARIENRRCIGCGVCVSACPVEAISLVIREKTAEPPSSAMSMYLRMFIGRFGRLKGLALLLKAGLGFKV